jgi:hypothetical protein
MVKDPVGYDPEVYQQMMEKNYIRRSTFAHTAKSSLYRLLWPHLADYTPRKNLYVERDLHTNYDYKTGAFPTLTHNYYDQRL